MIWLDRGHYGKTNCYLYRLDNLDYCEIILDVGFDSNEGYETCMFYVLKEDEKYYFFGASRNGAWKGYEITEKYADKLKDYSPARVQSHFKYLEEVMFYKSPYNGELE